MRAAHNFGREARQHLIRCVRGGNQQSDLRRVDTRFLDALAGRANAQIGSRGGGVHRRAAQEVTVIVHR